MALRQLILYLDVLLCTEEEEPGELAVSAVNDDGDQDSGAGGGDIEFKMTHEEVKEGNGWIDKVIQPSSISEYNIYTTEMTVICREQETVLVIQCKPSAQRLRSKAFACAKNARRLGHGTRRITPVRMRNESNMCRYGVPHKTCGHYTQV